MNCTFHTQEPYKLICFNTNCKQRILCLRCLINDHNSHPDQCQFIDEILNKDQQYNYQFPTIPIQQNEFLNGMIERFNLAIQSQRSDMLEIQEINYIKTPDVHKFLSDMATYTNFQDIYILIQQFVSQNTNKQILNQQITEFIQSEERKKYQEQLYALYTKLRDGEIQKFNQTAVKSITGSLTQQINILQKLTKDLTFKKVMGNKSEAVDNQIIGNSADPTAIFISTKIFHYNSDQTVKLTIKSLNLNPNSVFWLGLAYSRSSYANFANVQSQIYFQLIQEKNFQDVPGRMVGLKMKEIFQNNPNGLVNLEFTFNMKRKRLQISLNEISDKLEDGNNKEDQKKVNLGRKLALNTISTYYVIYVKLQYLNTIIEFE